MPDIDKINAVSLANIAKLDAVTAANIAKVNGLVFSTAPAFVGLLDTYTGAAAGYSTRRLASSATNLMRIREDSGDTETDIGYDSNGDLDTAAIATHCGTANGFVVTWYDQSGNANDAEQPTLGGAGLQPKIYDGTTQAVLTENGKPAVDFTRTSSTVGHYLDVPSYQWQDSNGLMTIFGVWRTDGTTSGQIWSDNLGGSNRSFQYTSGTYFSMTTITGSTPGSYDTSSNPTLVNDAQHLCTGIVTNGTLEQNVDGTQTDTTNTVVNARVGSFVARMGARPSASIEQLWDGRLQELIHYPSAQGSININGIEGNQNAHFQIGNFGTPTSGLLFDYPDAAAAYSVRQLVNTAALSMRVRRDTAGGTGDDDEADVLFDFTLTDPTISLDSRINNPSAYVASTTLGEFLNATGYNDVDNLTVVADGFCDTWYDQSGNGIDAKQTIFGEQPQIFDSASPTDLIKTNGQPSIYFDDTLDNNLVTPSSSWSTAGDTTIFCVWDKEPSSGAREVWSNVAVRWFGGTGASQVYVAPTAVAYTSVEVQNLFVYEHRDGVSKSVYIDGSQDATSATPGAVPTSSSIARIGRRYNSAESWIPMYQQELIVYPSDKSTNRPDIETDINDFFSIYT